MRLAAVVLPDCDASLLQLTVPHRIALESLYILSLHHFLPHRGHHWQFFL